MKALLDTNVFLEIILSQEKAEEAKSLLLKSSQHQFYIIDYPLHSVGLLLFRRKQHQAFQIFVEDVLLNGGINLLSLIPDDMDAMIAASKHFDLDFDDAYQYAVAAKFELILTSFDADFQRTDVGYKTPSQIPQIIS
jgi:hypothetical protein